ncbi:hypothetical protein BG011_008012 [Mortierella polycephala]|uniref:Uncharacterized protein n=1 Tax=Mortierella polycephala TaxID=41804 RepID=A0A9P6QDE5_9FUNG|nr:hypothetical protein BG011_008012 [Mortierella polycephala]
MLSALSHPSISSAPAGDSNSNNTGRAIAVQQYNGPHDQCNVSGGMVREAPLNDYNDHHMDYVIESPIHPLAADPSSSPSNCPGSSSPTATYPPQQHQQIVKLKSEHGLQQPRRMSRADVVMAENSTEAPMDSTSSSPTPLKPQSEVRDDDALSSPLHQLSQDIAHPSSDPNQLPDSSKDASVTSAMPVSTPITASPTPDSAPTGVSSRRSSMRPMPATLPRSALQEETVALFKHESKIRHMIAGVVYGHTLPNSISASSENVLAMAPPPTTTKSTRRPSQKNEDTKLTSAALQQLQEEQERGQQRQMQDQEHTDIADPAQQSFEEMNINGGHPHPLDDNRLAVGRWQGDGGRRPSLPPQQHRRPSYASQDSPMMDYEDSTMLPPPNQLQMPGTSPLENEIPRRYTPSGPHSSSTLTHRLASKLHHSQSHPNIGQQRQQQYHEQQEQLHEHRAGASGYSSQNQQHQYQQQLQRQIFRRESSHHQGNQYPRLEAVDRRYSHPAVLQPSSSSSGKYLLAHQSLSNDATSPALSSSPRYEPSPQHPLATPGNTPHMGSLPGPGGRYEETNISKSYYQRRMSQPIAYSCQLPPPPSGTYFDRRASDVEETHSNYQLREKHERLNASTLKHSKGNRILSQQQQYSPRVTSFMEATTTAMERDTKVEHRGGQGFSGTRHAYQTFYQQPSRDDLGLVDSHVDDSLQGERMSEDADYRSYSKMRSSFKRPNLGHPLSSSGSHPNLNSNTLNSAKDLTSAMPRNTIKLTCFPNVTSSSSPSSNSSEETAVLSTTTMGLDTKNALAMQLCKSSKVVIEITQPQGSQAFESSALTHDSRRRRSSLFPGFEDVPQPLSHHQQQPHQRSLRHTVSQPNLELERSTISVLGRRRSASPDGMTGYDGYGTSKKRRAESLSNARDDNEAQANPSASAAAAEAAAAAVVAAAANAARRQMNAKDPIAAASPSSTSLAGGLQIIGMDYVSSSKTNPSKGIGLGVHVPTEEEGGATTGAIGSPAIEALSVAMAPSYVKLEDQKEMGIDYSLFTRVETAGWRILIPPTVTASFLSDDFGLTLKPKVGANMESSHLDGQQMDVQEEVMVVEKVDCAAPKDEMMHDKDQQSEESRLEVMSDEKDMNDGAKVEHDKLQIMGQEDVSVQDTVAT